MYLRVVFLTCFSTDWTTGEVWSLLKRVMARFQDSPAQRLAQTFLDAKLAGRVEARRGAARAEEVAGGLGPGMP